MCLTGVCLSLSQFTSLQSQIWSILQTHINISQNNTLIQECWGPSQEIYIYCPWKVFLDN